MLLDAATLLQCGAGKHGRLHTTFMVPDAGRESVTGVTPGEASHPAAAYVSAGANHPLWMAPPAVRVALFANIAKRKMLEAQDHAAIARKEADKAEQEWKKSLHFATEAAARRDACMKYQYHASMVRSLNRLVAAGQRSAMMADAGLGSFGALPPEVAVVKDMVLKSSRLAKQAEDDVKSFEVSLNKLKKAKGFQDLYKEANGFHNRLEQQEKRLSEIRDSCIQAENIVTSQLPHTHDPPFLPKRLLRPDGDPWWPEKPPSP
eukprot:CAMPEP_0169262998 /NCGR_PEP_ID=MMETSP1016-20121227/44088_1 /TAXON_ID=342587 /ORGANISM="Karlodinium micrum, Strain CCMP2283" /LENGTH=261 /DNA_ID=CAMNT_0009345725 /DNA_START=15 /DNA_END=797 /DNA_ORIENTATION=-